MKSLSSASFFRTFDLLVGVSNPGLKQDRWKVEDVSCVRERHGFNGGTHCFAIEIFFFHAQNGMAGNSWWRRRIDGEQARRNWSNHFAGAIGPAAIPKES